MATQAQLDEKARQDRRGVQNPALESVATPAQLAEKGRQNGSSNFATPAQLAEKSRQNGVSTFATPGQLEEKRGRSSTPLSPFMEPSSSPYSTPAPPPYNADDAKRSALIAEQWRSTDPRSSSTHSLVPSESKGRRTLLLIYVHGFMGNETSFQSFPAHVHNLLTIQLSETHVVHTKIYPRYRSRKAIDFARDDFSHWLEPHENDHTEVVLLGHSMGGLLAAEVALQRPVTMATGQPFRHRLLGTVNFDTPFLGMHPGVVVSGIGSLFRPAPDPPGFRQESVAGADSIGSPGSSTYAPSISDASSQLTNSTSAHGNPSPNDPYYNPPFPNDVRLADRKGWSSFLHFVNKHSDGLASATKSYVMSHVEFGGAMADYPGLKNRYEKIRALEDVDDITRKPGTGYHPPARRIRFVNYYTASTGRPKSPKLPEASQAQEIDSNGTSQPVEVEMKDMALNPPRHSRSRSATPTPRISVEIHGTDGVRPQKLDDAPDASPLTNDSPIPAQIRNLGGSSGVQNDVQETELPPMRHIDSIPIEDDGDRAILTTTTTEDEVAGEQDGLSLQPTTSDPGLPPIPQMPREPLPFNPEAYSDKDSRKLAEKEHKRVMKVYSQAIKDRESAIKDRKKYVEKREKKIKQEQDKKARSQEKQKQREVKEEEKRKITINPEPREDRQGSTTAETLDSKPKRDKKFCMLPASSGGQRDKTWIRVYMEGVDEVGAHCGLFFPGPQYESLVGDVGERIAKWVEEDATRRAIAEVERGY